MRNNKPQLWLSLSLFITCFSFRTSLAALTTISANQSLSGDETLVSQGGEFELGFFNTGNNSNKFYIGMWYKKISQRTYVWVANRDQPVSDKNSAKLTILDGDLVLLDQYQNLVWSTNLNSPSSGSVVAVLLDSGNLVLSNRANASASDAMWQSFDRPTDTWLPGGKIKLDNKTKKPQYLTSWKNSEDPAQGLFSLELDPAGSTAYLILWNKSEQYWTSGAWNGHIFSLVPEMRLNYIYNFTFQSNENESYFTYSVYNSSIITRFVMDGSGQVKQLSWLENAQQWNLFWSQPRQQCEVYAFCGGFGSCTENAMPYCNCLNGYKPKSQSDWNLNDYSGGCVKKTNFQCENPNSSNKDKDRFLPILNMKLPNHSQSIGAGTSGECEATCLSNCSCTAYAYDNSGCSIWNGDLLNLQQLTQDDSSGQTLFLRLAASEFHDSKSNKGTVIGAAGAAAGVVVLLIVFVFVMLRRRRRHVGTGTSVEGSLMAFSYKDLQNATKNFSDKLGGGGFGSVFKGTLADSSIIAVKKLESISQGEKQFRTEVSTIGTVQHVNLVRLRGFCSEGTKKLLVYDYMPNGSLESKMFYEDSSKVLDWKVRYQIALGTARGLNYLHEKCRDCIIHCDVKPENILLDADFVPKVADFGLAKLVGRDFSRVLTTMRGTRGYLAPEWISGVAITAKADVYSYGMMLFEFVSGRRNSEASEDGQVRFFPTYAANMVHQGGNVLSLLDPRLEGNADLEEVTRVIKVASWCVQDDESHRPSMGQVVQILEGFLDLTLPPIPRTLQAFVDNHENIVFFDDSSSTQSSQVKSNASSASSQAKSNISSSKSST
ncbi:G-type lectin S-receptor-like serine/threonine-protein kinase At2g19130 [Glycine soja]|uniref:Receptor-like serine/threonine-protein kinase n=1 Tax=Glycine soja TaxID=3848 RepID=A0A445KGH5_GLYSO|nr:G-type lectin S-receptor-like serine/threonine-protein kinase At2g19130 [Glycine soja]KHN41183.1 G-type lectin S-receptor-like serine/threonine-protein kinase [Glycine soja]RZC09780.1 G-type lectin S-receptor-like serine/threonine-protein kinase [Glycine soja]